MTDRPTCATCVYCDPVDEGDSEVYGKCRRNPPQIIALEDIHSRFPRVRKDGWCGQHHKFPKWLYQPAPSGEAK